MKKNESKFVYLDCCESTNIELHRLALNNASNGTVVISKRQTNGQGTHDRIFYSPDNTGIYMSVLLRNISSNRLLDITPLAAVVVHDVLKHFCFIKPKIKPVNDIYIGEKKVCGILTQTQTLNKAVQFVIVGIGINLFRPTGGFPNELADTAGYILEKYDNVIYNDVIEKIADGLLTGASRLSDESFRNDIYKYYHENLYKKQGLSH